MNEKPQLRRKSFVYETSVRWVGDRAGTLSSEGKPPFRVTSPPEFGGEEGSWTPGSLFLASLEGCTMATFLALAARRGLTVVSYQSRAEVRLEYSEGAYRFTRASIRPTVVVSNEQHVEDARLILGEVLGHCMVANSVRTNVVVEGDVRAGTA